MNIQPDTWTAAVYDAAIRTKGQKTTTAVIADQAGVTPSFARRVLSGLQRRGLLQIKSARGCKGWVCISPVNLESMSNVPTKELNKHINEVANDLTKSIEEVTPPVYGPINVKALPVVPFLSPKALAAYQTHVPSIIMTSTRTAENLLKNPVDNCSLSHSPRLKELAPDTELSVSIPCQFIAHVFEHDGPMPESFVKEWAEMLNYFADNGWVASLRPASFMRLAQTAEYDNGVIGAVDSCTDLTTFTAELRALNEGQLYTPPKIVKILPAKTAVFSFLFFNGVWSVDDFNARFGTGLAVPEGHIGNPCGPVEGFQWRKHLIGYQVQ